MLDVCMCSEQTYCALVLTLTLLHCPHTVRSRVYVSVGRPSAKLRTFTLKIKQIRILFSLLKLRYNPVCVVSTVKPQPTNQPLFCLCLHGITPASNPCCRFAAVGLAGRRYLSIAAAADECALSAYVGS